MKWCLPFFNRFFFLHTSPSKHIFIPFLFYWTCPGRTTINKPRGRFEYFPSTEPAPHNYEHACSLAPAFVPGYWWFESPKPPHYTFCYATFKLMQHMRKRMVAWMNHPAMRLWKLNGKRGEELWWTLAETTHVHTYMGSDLWENFILTSPRTGKI